MILRWYRCDNWQGHKSPGRYLMTPASMPAQDWPETVPCAECGQAAVANTEHAERVWTSLRFRRGWARTEWHSESVNDPSRGRRGEEEKEAQIPGDTKNEGSK